MKFKEITNKKAKFEYAVVKRFEVGISLKGTEVRSIIDGHGSLLGAFAKVIKNEIFVFDFHVPNTVNQNWNRHDEKAPKKLLLHKKEILSIKKELDFNPKYTLVPFRVYYKNDKLKIELCLCYGRNNIDKREYIREREQKNESRNI